MPIPDTDPRPSGSLDNPIEPVAWIFSQIRDALDEAPDGRAPRWVRLARGRSIRDWGLGPALVEAVGVLGDFLSTVHHLALDLQDLLLQLDPAKAMVELILELAKAATAPELGQAVATLVDKPEVATAFSEAQQALRIPERYLNFIPEPSDVFRLGREIFQLLGVLYSGAVADPARAGRVRLLAWGFERSINVQHGPRGGARRRVAVRALGVLCRSVGAAAPTSPLSATWPVGDPKGVPLYALDLSQGPDVEDAIALLDALGYTEPACTAQSGVDGPLSARLQVFQLLNDLPVSGALDAHTIHRLLNLDAAGRNIARARPMDPARWRAIPAPPAPRRDRVVRHVILDVPVFERHPEDPPRSGVVRLVNPDADGYADEGISLEPEGGARRGVGQKTPRRWYICGAPVPDGAERAAFPEGVEQGWIRHRIDDEIVPEGRPDRPLDGAFVALERRPVLGRGFEGGAWSEGDALSGRFFFSAREAEPWMSGRTGGPGPDARYKKAPGPGALSGMYQWASVAELAAQARKAGDILIFQALCARRSLYKEAGTGQLPDQGRIVLGLARAGALPQEKPLATRFRPDQVLGAYSWSGWWPSQLQEDLMRRASQRAQGDDWVTIATPPIQAPDDVIAVFVGLYGRHSANLDTDAYFDDVRIVWERHARPDAAPEATDG